MTAATEPSRPVGWRPFRRHAIVDRAFDPVRSYLSAAPARLLGDRAATPAGGDGVPTGLHLRRVGLDMSREARVVLGDLETGSRFARIQLKWADARRPKLFPVLEALLEITPAASDDGPKTRLVLSGGYVPPFGRLGAAADRLIGRRLVLQSVDSFLGRFAESLEQDLPPEPVRQWQSTGPKQEWGGARRRVFLRLEGAARPEEEA
jgi:hypothetical protein